MPQPIYFFIGELFKIFGPYHDLYYPYKSSIIGQFILIIVLYIPFFVNYHMVKRLIRTNTRLLHPSYNFETGQITTRKSDCSPSEESLTGSVGGFRTAAKPGELGHDSPMNDDHRNTVHTIQDEEEKEEDTLSEEERKVNMFPRSNRTTHDISDDENKKAL